MKLNKKRISILVSLMCLLVLLVFTLCSFDLPNYPDEHSELLLVSNITSAERDKIKTIIDLQLMLGQFNSLEPLYIFHSNTFYAVFALPSATINFSTSGSGSNTMYKYELSGTQSNAFVQIGFSEEGFAVYSVISASSLSVYRSSVLYYRTSFDNPLSTSGYYSFSSGSSVRSEISDVESYWQQFANKMVHSGASSEELESAYIDGYGDGYFDGKDVGYGLGFESGYIEGETAGFNSGYMEGNEDGFDLGYSTGYGDGFSDGEDVGYDTGYADGYQDGYDTGYSDGLEDAPPETVTIVIYEEPVEIDVPGIISSVSSIPDSILSGSFDFEFAGINIYGLLKLLIIVFIISAVIFFIIKRSA